MDRDQYVRDIVSRDLEGPRALDGILRSFHDEAADGGMADADLLNLFEDARTDPAASHKS